MLDSLPKKCPTARDVPLRRFLHFTFDEGVQRWLLPDGKWLYEILRGELLAEQVEVVL